MKSPDWFTRLRNRLINRTPHNEAAPVGLMSRNEKVELEGLLEEKLVAFYDRHGGGRFLEPGWAIFLSAQGGPIISCEPPDATVLARIEFQHLLSIRSLIAIEQPMLMVSRSMLQNLATEATHELALQVNKMAAELSGHADGKTPFVVPSSVRTRRDE